MVHCGKNNHCLTKGPFINASWFGRSQDLKKTCIHYVYIYIHICSYDMYILYTVYIYIYTCTTWKVDVATPMFWFIITPYKSPPNLGVAIAIYFRQQKCELPSEVSGLRVGPLHSKTRRPLFEGPGKTGKTHIPPLEGDGRSGEPIHSKVLGTVVR